MLPWYYYISIELAFRIPLSQFQFLEWTLTSICRMCSLGKEPFGVLMEAGLGRGELGCSTIALRFL